MNENQMRTKQQSTGPTDGGRANRFRKIANLIVFKGSALTLEYQTNDATQQDLSSISTYLLIYLVNNCIFLTTICSLHDGNMERADVWCEWIARKLRP